MILCCEFARKQIKKSFPALGTNVGCVCRVRLWGWMVVYWAGTQTWWAARGPGWPWLEKQRASCGEQHLLRLISSRRGWDARAGKTPSLQAVIEKYRKQQQPRSQNEAECNYGIGAIIATIYSACWVYYSKCFPCINSFNPHFMAKK